MGNSAKIKKTKHGDVPQHGNGPNANESIRKPSHVQAVIRHGLIVACVFWAFGSSVAFLASDRALDMTRDHLQSVIQKNNEFVAALENDQKHVHDLRMRYEAEKQKTERLVNEFESIRLTSQSILGGNPPDTPLRFSSWLGGQLADRIRAVDAENDGLSAMIVNLAASLGTVSGEQPPEDMTEIPLWFENKGALLSQGLTHQADAMSDLTLTLSNALNMQYELISKTPLADVESLGKTWNPMYGKGGVDGSTDTAERIFPNFEARAKVLLQLSDELMRLDQLLICTPFAAPVDYYHLTSAFGSRRDPFTNRKAWHDGVDLGAWPGTKVRATASGIVTHAGVKGGFGRVVVIDHGCGIETLYAHLKSISVEVGQAVSHRDVIGAVGNTGRSTGPHVHYEIRINDEPVDPYRFIDAGRHVFKLTDQYGSLSGAISGH